MRPPIVFYPNGALTDATIEELYRVNYLPVKWEGIVSPELKCELDLRDYFAAKAMQGFAADPQFSGGPKEAANFAYQWSDAMLLERSKNDK